MKERPILFSTEMVRAILEGRKTQTRRLSGLEDVNEYPGKLSGISVLSPLGYKGLEPTDYNIKNKRDYAKNPGLYHWFLGEQNEINEINPIPVKCPYGQPGDRLWVRETWGVGALETSPWDFAAYIAYRADNRHSLPIDYARCKRISLTSKPDITVSPQYWRPSIFMPRWASRITLEIVNIRVERVQDISEDDAIAEGIDYLFSKDDCLTTAGLIGTEPKDHGYKNYLWHGDYGRYGEGNKQSDSWSYQYSGYKNAIGSYSSLWEKTSAKRGYGWDVNPWVWVIEFKFVKVATISQARQAAEMEEENYG